MTAHGRYTDGDVPGLTVFSLSTRVRAVWR
jgi:hypothetical protein